MRRQFSFSQWVINHKLAENPGIGWPSHVHSYYYWGKWLPFAKLLTSDSKVRQNSNPAHVLHRSYVSSLDQCVLTSILFVILHFRQIWKAHTASGGLSFSKQRCIFEEKSMQIFSHFIPFLLLTETHGWKDPLQSSNLIHDCMHLSM